VSYSRKERKHKRSAQDGNMTLVLIAKELSIVDENTVRTLIASRQELGRACLSRVCINAHGEELFIKTARIDSLPSKLRIRLGLKRLSGVYDWSLAELRNNIIANERTRDIPNLTGYGFVRRFGLPKEMFLIFETLEGHIHGLSWVRLYPAQGLAFAQATLQLLHRLNQKGIYHLDLWAANIMLRPGELSELKAVDLENCYIGKTTYHSETLGFQFGFLYQFALRDFVTEAEYDALVYGYLANYAPEVDHMRFMPFFKRFKILAAGRKERYLIPKKGLLIHGKPAKKTAY
jgi:hypothetical protein